jgi:hypothetical protein
MTGPMVWASDGEFYIADTETPRDGYSSPRLARCDIVQTPDDRTGEALWRLIVAAVESHAKDRAAVPFGGAPPP